MINWRACAASPCCSFNSRVPDGFVPVPDVLLDRHVEQDGVLADDRDVVAEVLNVDQA